jgi:hypothetical protein
MTTQPATSTLPTAGDAYQTICLDTLTSRARPRVRYTIALAKAIVASAERNADATADLEWADHQDSGIYADREDCRRSVYATTAEMWIDGLDISPKGEASLKAYVEKHTAPRYRAVAKVAAPAAAASAKLKRVAERIEQWAAGEFAPVASEPADAHPVSCSGCRECCDAPGMLPHGRSKPASELGELETAVLAYAFEHGRVSRFSQAYGCHRGVGVRVIRALAKQGLIVLWAAELGNPRAGYGTYVLASDPNDAPIDVREPAPPAAKFGQRFAGKANAGLRAKIRDITSSERCGQANAALVRGLARAVAFTVQGLAALEQVAADFEMHGGSWRRTCDCDGCMRGLKAGR